MQASYNVLQWLPIGTQVNWHTGGPWYVIKHYVTLDKQYYYMLNHGLLMPVAFTPYLRY